MIITRSGALLLAVIVASCGGNDSGSEGGSSGNPSGIGNYCEVDEDCPTGTCYLGPGGGYCTSPCSREGETGDCPADTVCKPIQGGPSRCLLICGSESSCRESEPCGSLYCPQGSACVSVDSTEHRGCEPEPV